MATKGQNKAKDRRAARKAERNNFDTKAPMLGKIGAGSYRGGRRAAIRGADGRNVAKLPDPSDAENWDDNAYWG